MMPPPHGPPPPPDPGRRVAFLLRLPPDLRQKLAGNAAGMKMSLNAYLGEILAHAAERDELSPVEPLVRPGERRPTLADIAAEVRCSKGTVSRALSGDVRITAATRQRVVDAANRLGYRPDPVLAALAEYRWGGAKQITRTIGLVACDARHSPALVSGVHKSASRLGYGVDLLQLDQMGSPERLLRAARARGIRGLVFLPVPDDSPAPQYDLKGIAAVCAVRNAQSPPVHGTSGNAFLPVLEAVLVAVERGYRRIAAAIGRSPQFARRKPTQIPQAWHAFRGEAFGFAADAELHIHRKAALAFLREELPAGVEILPVYEGSILPEGGPAIAHWVRELRPDCVIGLTDSVFWRLWEAGLKAPRDFGYCSLSAAAAPAKPIHDASGFVSRIDEIGALAVWWLDQLLRRNETGYPARPQTLRVEPEWHEGRTLPRKRGKPMPRPRRDRLPVF